MNVRRRAEVERLLNQALRTLNNVLELVDSGPVADCTYEAKFCACDALAALKEASAPIEREERRLGRWNAGEPIPSDRLQ